MTHISPGLRETPPVTPSPTVAERPGPPPAQEETPGAGRRVALALARLPRPGAADREVLRLYLLTRVALWVTAYCTLRALPQDSSSHSAGPFFGAFRQWDWFHYLAIARDGYFPGGDGPWRAGWDNREAFFPGFPLALRAVHAVVPYWTAAGLLVSFAAGAVAVVALARIARHHLPHPDGGRRAVLFLLLSPCAVFLAVGYTESLFLAFALPAWLAARRRDWVWAAVLAAAATAVRVSGLFLAAAIALHFVLTVRARRDWRPLPWLALPALPAALYSGFLYARTGDWMAWKHAEERGWYRTFHTPWDAWAHTWQGAFDSTQSTGYAIMFQFELVAMVLGVVLLGLLVRRRRWPEALYVGLSLWALGTSYWYMSVPRATLLWWPLWIGLASWSLRRPGRATAYLCVCAPLSTVLAVAFLSGHWAG